MKNGDGAEGRAAVERPRPAFDMKDRIQNPDLRIKLKLHEKKIGRMEKALPGVCRRPCILIRKPV